MAGLARMPDDWRTLATGSYISRQVAGERCRKHDASRFPRAVVLRQGSGGEVWWVARLVVDVRLGTEGQTATDWVTSENVDRRGRLRHNTARGSFASHGTGSGEGAEKQAADFDWQGASTLDQATGP